LSQPEIVIEYEEDDKITHTDEQPCCTDDSCPCHEDEVAVSNLLVQMFPGTQVA